MTTTGCGTFCTGPDWKPRRKRAAASPRASGASGKGAFAEAVRLLRRAARLDPSDARYHQKLAAALRANGRRRRAPRWRWNRDWPITRRSAFLSKEHQDLTGAQVALSTDRVDFGVLRQGQSRSAQVTVRNSGGGVLQGRVASAPGWVRVEPAAFTTRQRQPLTLTAVTGHIWQAPAAYQETVVLETSGGRQEIAVLASVLPARRGLAQIVHWYFPLLLCCLLPAIAGTLAPLLGHFAPNHFPHPRALPPCGSPAWWRAVCCAGRCSCWPSPPTRSGRCACCRWA